MTSTGVFQQGNLVYFLHPKHSWVMGCVTSVEKKSYTCRPDDKLRELTSNEAVEKIPEDHIATCREDLSNENVDDLLNLTILHDATLLRCLYLRYFKDIVYTNIGAIIVALNPFNYKIPHYMDSMMAGYLSEGEKIEKNLPHSWSQAHNTYRDMMRDRVNQCILISGESGAGKTEATKIVMKYLAQISCHVATDEERAAGMAVGTKLAACSPVLESFGNAKTVRNDNSSRFGKFMKVKFTQTGHLVGAHTTKYLLEKSRIITAATGERVYHSFYLCARGNIARKLGMDSDTAYVSLNSGGNLHNNEFDTEEDYNTVVTSMKEIGMDDTSIDDVWTCVAGVLSMTNVIFQKKDEGSTIDPKSEKYLDFAAKAWGIDAAQLRSELIQNKIEVRGETSLKLNSPTQATDVRDALSKALYNEIFSWLVEKSNDQCDVPNADMWIGLLDIFGFEDFEVNSFEQLCINLANETLQNHYNTYIFSKDFEEYRKEGINVDEIKCPDNKPCLQLISGKGSIFALLDEECMLGANGNENSFLDKCDRGCASNPFFEKKKISRTAFVIKHYAANVTYTITGWLDKNRDTLKDTVRNMMRSSTKPFIAKLLAAPAENARRQTVAGFFKEQVALLMELINSTNPHWIRCIKPHPAKKPRMFDGISTMNQLSSSGVLGTVKVRKAGYPIRIPYNTFLARYDIITADKNAQDDVATTKNVLKAAGITDPIKAQYGTARVFLKSEVYGILEAARNQALVTWTARLQRTGRGHLDRIKVFRLWVHRERDRLIAEKKAREEAERKERERNEEERKAREEAERKAREEAERKAREEAQRREKELFHAAVSFQRVYRGRSVRRRVYREIIERERARYERSVEIKMMESRRSYALVEARRAAVEHAWIQYLQRIEQLRKRKELDHLRREKVEAERHRISERQKLRAELAAHKQREEEERINAAVQAARAATKRHVIETKRHAILARPQPPRTEAQVACVPEFAKMNSVEESLRRMAHGSEMDSNSKTTVAFMHQRAQAWDVAAHRQNLPEPVTYLSDAVHIDDISLSHQRTPISPSLLIHSVRDPRCFEEMKSWWQLREEYDEHREELQKSDLNRTPVRVGLNRTRQERTISQEGRCPPLPSVGDATVLSIPVASTPCCPISPRLTTGLSGNNIRERSDPLPPHLARPRSNQTVNRALEMDYRRRMDAKHLIQPDL